MCTIITLKWVYILSMNTTGLYDIDKHKYKIEYTLKIFFRYIVFRSFNNILVVRCIC